MRVTSVIICLLLLLWSVIARAQQPADKKPPPNFVIIYSDDQRYDALGCQFEGKAITPNLDKLCASGMYFEDACVTLSICSPSRAALLTGRYGRANGVTTFGKTPIREGEKTFAQYLKDKGYQTGLVGKWHLGNSPASLGFDDASYFFSNGSWYGRKVTESGQEKIAEGFIEDYNARRAIAFLESTKNKDNPYLLFYCPQLPHLDNQFNWDVTDKALSEYDQRRVKLPGNWPDEALEGKPDYLRRGRHREKAISYGYQDPDTLKYQIKRYYAAITEMDAAMGRVLQKVRELPNAENTYIIFMSDNGWFIGDHLFTSKVLAYEESMRVPLIVTGPGIAPGRNRDLVLNIDIFPTLLDIMGESIPSELHGKSLWKPLTNQKWPGRREYVYYDAPTSQLGSMPLAALRTDRYKYIETYQEENPDEIVFQELYDLEKDPYELKNIASEKAHHHLTRKFSQTLKKEQKLYR